MFCCLCGIFFYVEFQIANIAADIIDEVIESYVYLVNCFAYANPGQTRHTMHVR